MSALDAFRQELRARLGAEVFLRRDQAARALFICDAPRRLADFETAKCQLEQLGYDVREENRLWRIDLSPVRQAAYLRSLPHPPLSGSPEMRSLCRSLLSQGEPPPAAQPWPWIRLTLLCLDAGQYDRLYQELSAAAATLKRTHAPLPAAAAYLILNALQKEELIC